MFDANNQLGTKHKVKIMKPNFHMELRSIREEKLHKMSQRANLIVERSLLLPLNDHANVIRLIQIEKELNLLNI